MAPTNNNSTWVTPRTWSTGELVTASIMNAHVRDNLNALHVPAGGYNFLNLVADITTTSTSFADVDATNLILTFTTGGGDVLFFFTGAVTNSGVNGKTYLDVFESVANTRIGTDDGLTIVTTANASLPINASFSVRFTGLSAASHSFKLQWKVSAGTSTMYAGAGTASFDLHPSIYAIEI